MMFDENDLNSTIPGGAYISGGQVRGDKHFGGRVVDCDGNVLVEFAPNEENTGRFAVEWDKEKGKVVPAKAAKSKPDAK